MNEQYLIDWFQLVYYSGLTQEQVYQLLVEIGLPREIFQSNYTTLRNVVGEEAAIKLRHPLSQEAKKQIREILMWVNKTPGARILTLDDSNYPKSLLSVGSVPLMFFAIGDLSLLSRPTVSFVGTSHPTDEGEALVTQWAKCLSKESQLSIVESDGKGVEWLALCSVAKTGPMNLVWVCSHSLVDKTVQEKVRFLSSKGLVISSVLPLEDSLVEQTHNDTKRLLLAVVDNFVVIQAGRQSRVLKLIREAGDLGCDVMAVPGSVFHPLSKGCHQLIKQGALLVEGTDDILTALKIKK